MQHFLSLTVWRACIIDNPNTESWMNARNLPRTTFLHPHLFRLRSSSTYRRASIPMPSASPLGPHPAAVPPILLFCPPLPMPIAHMPLANLLPELLAVGGGESRARLTRNASLSSFVLNSREGMVDTSVLVDSSSTCEGGNRIQTTHHPRLVLHVRSISLRLLLVATSVARIWECTLSASTLFQPCALFLLLLRPSAMSVPGSGTSGRLECTVSVRGSYTRS
jgi:hypothetical protein